MTRSGADKRSSLVEAASRLAHLRGFGSTALADIAREAEFPLGNVYYYFKTKAELGEAVIAQHLEELRRLRREWDKLESPKGRLLELVRMTVENRESLARSGCPVGSLSSELHKEGGTLAGEATGLFAEMLRWIEAQFTALGKGRERKALALHLLSALQGASLLAHSFGDPQIVVVEANHLKTWIGTL